MTQPGLRGWLNGLHFNNQIEQQQAPIVQIFLLGIIVVAPLVALIFTATLGFVGGVQFAVAAQLLSVPFAVVALVLLRRDRFTLAGLTIVAGLLIVFVIACVPLGTRSGGSLFIIFLLPITLAGLLLSRRALVLVVAASIAIVMLIVALEPLLPGVIGFAPLPGNPAAAIATTFVGIVLLLGLLLDQFAGTLRSALNATLAREHELEQLRASLETTVAERTASLQTALEDVAQREARLAHTLAELRSSQDAMQELSAPVLPVLSGVLVAPLIGTIDNARAAVLTQHVLDTVQRLRTQYVIFDITGVPILDTHVAQVIISTATAVQLLGAQVLLVGVRPEVAQTMVALHINLGPITSYPDLQQAVEALLARTGWQHTLSTPAAAAARKQ